MDRLRTPGSKSGPMFLMDSVLMCLFVAGCSRAECGACVEYCCDGAPPFCCSYYTYAGKVLSGTAISGLVFGVVFLMGAVAAMCLCVCVCVKNRQGVRVQDVAASYLSTVSLSYAGPPPPYCYDSEMDPHSYPEMGLHSYAPPAYTSATPRTGGCSPPPPYPGSPHK